MKNFKKFKDQKDQRFKNVNYLNIKEYTWNKDINKHQLEEIFKKLDQPMVIRNYYDSIAVQRWNQDTISDIFGDLVLSAEVYTSNTTYYNANISGMEKEITVRDYMEHMKNVEKPPYYYLAEIDLYEKIDDPAMSSYILSDTFNENEDKNDHQVESLYMGYYTTSGCHVHIEDDYVLNQIIGTKEIIMFDYHDNEEHITRRSVFDSGSNFIQEDFFEQDHNKFNNLYKITLNPGDSLFIPPWWYHTVRGSQFSCSITRIHNRKDNSYYYTPSIKYMLILLHIYNYYFAPDGEYNYILIITSLAFILTFILIFSLLFKKILFTIYNG